MELKPLHVTAYLQSGRIVTTDLNLPLDSVLAWAWMMQYRPEKMQASQSGFSEDEFETPQLPLERREAYGEWYWACSFAFGQPRLETKSYWHKRFDMNAAEKYVDFGKRRGSVNTGSGFYKNYRMPMVEFLVPKLEWWLVGDKAEVEKLLAWVTHLGKKRSQGKGRVARWSVEYSDVDRSDARPIPDPEGDVYASIRPPYWWYKNETLVRWPDESELACNWMRSGRLVG